MQLGASSVPSPSSNFPDPAPPAEASRPFQHVQLVGLPLSSSSPLCPCVHLQRWGCCAPVTCAAPAHYFYSTLIWEAPAPGRVFGWRLPVSFSPPVLSTPGLITDLFVAAAAALVLFSPRCDDHYTNPAPARTPSSFVALLSCLFGPVLSLGLRARDHTTGC